MPHPDETRSDGTPRNPVQSVTIGCAPGGCPRLSNYIIESTTNRLCSEINSWSKEKGWWEHLKEVPPTTAFLEKIALCHTELSEAVEDARIHGLEPTKLLSFSPESNPPGKPEGIGSELADVLVRIYDIAGQFHIDLGKALSTKLEYNRLRSHRHGGKQA